MGFPESAGPGAVRTVLRRYRLGHGRGLDHEARHGHQRQASAVARAAQLSLAASAQPGRELVGTRQIFLTRVGTIILTLMIILWFLSTFPGPPDHATHPPIYYSMAGILGRGLEVIFAPIGFNWQICIALVPGMAAREVAVGALGTVYALSQTGDSLATALSPLIAHSWPLSTALSLLAWYVFAPQCLSTLSVVKRETGGWRYPLIMAGYMFALAYGASFITYRVALMFGA